MEKNIRQLVIGDLVAKVPVIQGGMGVGVSLHRLAGAVAANGGVGVISTAQIGYRDPLFDREPIEANLRAIGEEIAKARELAKGGIIGVNIMVVTQRYEDYVHAAVAAGVDLIISGAGLPMKLPELVQGSPVKIAPIVSGRKALDVIVRYWQKKYHRLPDLVIIEGPKAGGHLGFSREELEQITTASYDEQIREVIALVRALERENGVKIPVALAGGIYDRADYDHAMELGADAVQMATRFVTTEECDASEAYKEAYIHAQEEDIILIKSPVGLPGRAIHNAFIDRIEAGERFMEGCRRCITTCKPATAPYCITRALINAVEGNVDQGLIFCGSNAYRCNQMETVAGIMEEFTS